MLFIGTSNVHRGIPHSKKILKVFRLHIFCAEFGLAECLPIYSGGLGCLAGDHLKSAAETRASISGCWVVVSARVFSAIS